MKHMKVWLLTTAMIGGLLAGCGNTQTTSGTDGSEASAASEKTSVVQESTASDGQYKVGISIQTLSNSYWAGVMGEVENCIKEKGWEYTILDCNDNSAEQMSQIENFTSSGYDLIMVQPSDPNAIEDVCAAARDKGIKVMCWDDQMTNTDVNWVLDNKELGETIGKAAAEFINAHYSEDQKAQVAIINYPQTPIIVERENGIDEGLKDADGKYEIVSRQPAADAGTAMSAMETILQSNPDTTIVCSVGSGGDIGCNEAFLVKYNEQIPDNVGIFSADATQQQMQAIKDGQASRVTVGFEGSDKRTAAAAVDLFEQLLTGQTFADQNVYRDLTAISADNVDEFLADYK